MFKGLFPLVARFGDSAVESALMLKALCDRLARVVWRPRPVFCEVLCEVGEQVDTFQTLLAPKAANLGNAVGVEKRLDLSKP